MIRIAPHLYTTQELSSTRSKNILCKFTDRSNCLHNLMWEAYSLLEQGKQVTVCVNDKSDLNAINYFLSKYELTQVSKIFDHNTLIDLSPDNSVYGLGMNRGDSKEIETALLNHIDRVVQKMKELKSPCHNRMNIVQLSDAQLLQTHLHSESKLSHLDVLIDNDELPIIKKILSEAQGLYNFTFRHIARFDPFNDEVFNDDLGSIKMFLTNMLTDIDAIVDQFNSVEAQISSCYKNSQLESVTKLNNLQHEISKLKNVNHTEYSDTHISKLKFNIENIANIIDDVVLFSDDINIAIESIQSKVKSYIEKLIASTSDKVEHLLKITTVHNSTSDIKNLQFKVNKIIEEINDTSILRKVYNIKAVSFYNLRSIIREVSDDVSFAIYFIEEHHAYINWLHYLKRLSLMDREIVNKFLSVKSSWEDDLETQLAVKGIQEALLRIQSIPQSLSGLHSTIEDYLNVNHSIVTHLSNKINTNDSLEVHLNPNFDDLVTSRIDSVLIALNHVPSHLLQYSGVRLFSYIDNYSDSEHDQIRKIPDLEIMRDNGIHHQITNKLKQMKSQDHNRAALYLGQSLHNMNPAYVIFKLKYVTIISFLSELKNTQLRESLYGVGVKEIFSNIENYNFLPGIFSDIESQPVVLLEDGLIDISKMDNIIRQICVKEEMITSGLHIIDIDNYSIIKGETSIQSLSDKIIAMNHNSEPVLT